MRLDVPLNRILMQVINDSRLLTNRRRRYQSGTLIKGRIENEVGKKAKSYDDDDDDLKRLFIHKTKWWVVTSTSRLTSGQ